jgi:class 3 adenylate cyclase
MEAPTLDRRLVAILAADVEGYSRLMALDEEAALATLSAHRAVVDEVVLTFRGRIANTAGDSVLAEFASVVDAVRCAIQLQETIAAANRDLPPERQMLFRMGINVGDVMAKDGDIFGDGVNIAARLQTLADAGGVCVSRGVRDHIRHLGSFRFEDLGEQLVKNIERPVRAFRVVADSEVAAETSSHHSEPPGLSLEGLAADRTARDLALWQAVADSEQVAEFLHYLERFPEGEFATLARTRIASLSQGSAPAGPVLDAETTVELTFWDSVKDSDNPAMYVAYLDKYPAGNFAPIARAKLDELR